MFISERIFGALRHHNRIVKMARVVLVVVTAVAVWRTCMPMECTAAVVLYMKGDAINLEQVGAPFFRYAAFEAVVGGKAQEVPPPRECWRPP